jgi:hypothetical protein
MDAPHYRGNAMETAAEIADQKKTALGLIMDAFHDAEADGVDSDCMAQATLFYVLKEFVLAYGEEAVAAFAERLPGRIRDGEFSVLRHG